MRRSVSYHDLLTVFWGLMHSLILSQHSKIFLFWELLLSSLQAITLPRTAIDMNWTVAICTFLDNGRYLSLDAVNKNTSFAWGREMLQLVNMIAYFIFLIITNSSVNDKLAWTILFKVYFSVKLQIIEVGADAANAKGKDSLGRITCVLSRWQTNWAVSIHESCTSAFKLFFWVCSLILPPKSP